MSKNNYKVSIALKSMLLLSVLILVFVSGCADKKIEPQQTAQTTDKIQVVEIKIDGAVTNYPLANTAAKEFMKENPDVQIMVKQSNTATGIQKLIAGEIDIADSTRLPTNNETEAAKAKGMTLHGTVEAYDAIAIITHPTNPITDISMQQLKDIYFSGNITDWSQITNGSKKGKIIIYNTNPNKVGTPAVFNKKVTGNENTAYVNGTILFDTLELMDPAILNDENSIGVKQLAGIDPKIKVLKVNGEYPTNKAVIDATYPLGRQVFLITNGQPEGKIRDFINFILSEKGQTIAQKEGFVPLI